MKNFIKEFVRYYKEKIKQVKEVVKENLKKFLDLVKFIFRYFKDIIKNIFDEKGNKRFGVIKEVVEKLRIVFSDYLYLQYKVFIENYYNRGFIM